MAIVVQKYGGSSVSDVQKLTQVADRVMRTQRSGHQVVVVVSAMGDTTDELLQLGSEALDAIGVTADGLSTSSFRITWLMPRERTDEAVRTLHERFIESERPVLP